MSQKVRVGSRIREIRKRRGLTQEVLAERVERSVDAISALERGRALPSFETLEKLAQALDVPLGDFFDHAHDEGADDRRVRLLTHLMVSARALNTDELEVAVEQIAALGRRKR
jgi:transcriptional regulator with XRE-family HTH domain